MDPLYGSFYIFYPSMSLQVRAYCPKHRNIEFIHTRSLYTCSSNYLAVSWAQNYNIAIPLQVSSLALLLLVPYLVSSSCLSTAARPPLK